MESVIDQGLKHGDCLEEYSKEMQSYIDPGNFKELSEDEINAWTGPVKHITYHEVYKPSSLLRVVSNSSLQNNWSGGLSNNNILPKGPNVINPFKQFLVTWRSYVKVTTLDYSKAYNTFATLED